MAVARKEQAAARSNMALKSTVEPPALPCCRDVRFTTEAQAACLPLFVSR